MGEEGEGEDAPRLCRVASSRRNKVVVLLSHVVIVAMSSSSSLRHRLIGSSNTAS